MLSIVRRLVALFALLSATSALAQTYTYSIYVDTDNNTATGCSVSLPGGNIAGAESVLTATINAGSPPQLAQMTRSSCAGGSFGAPVGFGTAAVSVGAGGSGTTAIELSGALANIAPGATTIRLYAVASSATGSDVLLTTTGAGSGGPILLALSAPPGQGGTIPAPLIGIPAVLLLIMGLLLFGSRAARRRLLKRALVGLAFVSGIAGAAIFNWNGVTALANDPAGDATSGEAAIDLRALFAALGNGNLYFRLDVSGDLSVPIAAPVAAADSYTTPINTALTVPAPGVLGNDTLNAATISAHTNPAHGTLTLNADGGFTYTPTSGYAGGDSFTYTLTNGGGNSTATASLVVGSNHVPSFTKGADQSVLEDAAPQSIANWATAISDGDGNTQTLNFIVTNANNALFSTQPAVSPTGTLTYTLAPNANGTATVSVQLHDNGGTVSGGVDTSSTQTFAINVTAVNDAPSFTKGADQAVLEDSPAQTVTGWATAISAGPADESAQTLNFIVGNDNNALFTVQPAIAANGTLTYTPAAGKIGTANVSVQLHDNGGTASGGVDTSAAQTFTIKLTLVNHAPSFTKGADQAVLEDAVAQSIAGWATGISDGDGNTQALNFIVTNTNNALFSVQPAISPTGTLTYTLAPNANGTATVSVQLHDDGGTASGGVDTSAAQTFTVTVTAVNDAPSFTKGADENALEDSGAHTVANWATNLSAGPADEAGQTLNFIVSNDNNALFTVQPAIAANGTLTYTLASGQKGTANVSVLIHDNGGTANGGVDTSVAQTFKIIAAAVNHAPSFTKGVDQSVFEDAAAQSIAGWATGISDGDGNTQALNFIVSNNNNALFSTQPAISPTGTLTYTLAPNANGTATVSVQLHDDGGTASGGVDTSPAQTFAINVTAVNDAPGFVKGADQSVLEDAPAQTVTGWATAISAGPADESAQTLNFIVSNNNNALFSAQPAVAPNGTLTFTVAPVQTGTAIVSVSLHDSGGTANGGVDTSPVQTFIITVFDVNHAPSFTKGADQTVLEDAPAQTINPWATAISPGPANEAGQTVDFIVSNDNNALFSVQPVISPTGILTYTLAANANGLATVTVKLHDNGGTASGGVDTSAPQTFTITVTAVNDAPSFTKGADQSVLEDSGVHTVANWATALSAGPADESAQTLNFIVSNNNNALFSTQPAVAPDGTLSYTLAAGKSGVATVSVQIHDNGGTANGGVDTSIAQTFAINVALINHAPSFTKGADQTVLEDAPAQNVAGWATAINDNDGGGQALNFIVSNDNNALFSVQPAISPTGTLSYTLAANANGTTTVTVQLHDNGGTANGGVDTSAAQTFVINVTAVNDAPSFTKGADESVLEDSGAHSVSNWATALSAGPADESAQTLNFIVGNNNNALFSTQPAIAPDGTLSYTLAAGKSGVATVSVQIHDNGGTANGGVDTSAVQTFAINVALVNHAPSFTKGADQTVLEDAAAQSIVGWATAINDNDGGVQTLNFIVSNSNNALFSVQPAIAANGTLSYTLAANANGTATVTVQLHDNGGTANGGVDTSPTQTFVINVTAVNDAPSFTKGSDQTVLEDSGAHVVPGWASATSPGPADESSQTVSFLVTGNTNPALFSAAPAVAADGTLSYTSAPDANGTATITLVAKDSGGTANGGVDTSSPQTFIINVTAVNDAPSFVKGADEDVLDNIGLKTVPGWATAISAGPANEAGQALNFIVSNDNNAAFTAGGQPAIAANGTLTYTPAVQSTAGSLTANVTLQIHDNGGTANGGVDTSATQTFTIKITHANIAPTLTTSTITYTTAGNTQLLVAGATLPGVASITDPNGILSKSAPTDTDGPQPPSMVPTFGTSTFGGTYSINVNGSFNYAPPAGFNGTDTFPFTVTDQATPTAGTVTGTVSVSVSQKVWYVRDLVDANNPAGGDGRSNNAFETLAGAQGAAGAGDIIFVFRGNTGTTPLGGGIVLKNGQRLWGEGIGLTLPTFGTLVPAGSKPRINVAAASAVSVPATAGDMTGVEIRGLDLQGVPNAVNVNATGAFNVNVLVSDNTVSGATADGIKATFGSTSTTQQIAVSNNTVTATGNGIDLSRSAGTAYVTAFANNTISGNTAGTGVNISNMTFDATPGGAYQTVSSGTMAIGVSGNGVGASGMVLSNVSGDIAFTDLDIYADNGAALSLTGTGVVNLGAGTGTRVTVGAGVATFTAVGGPAASVGSATIDLQLASLSSTNSATTGVSLDTIAGTFSAPAGSTISNATGTDFNINAGNATVTYNGTITDTTGRLVSITSTTGGTKTFSGAISDSGGGTGQGIFLNTNTGATIAFSAPLTLSTGANAAFTATGGGTVTATDTTSTVATTTATAVNIANTTIGAGGVKFKSVNAGTVASGPANGIVLNQTGTTGTLTVIGTGAAGSGGTIQKTTAEGVLITGPANASLSWMNVKDSGTHGISATTANNLTLVSVAVTDAAGNTTTDDGLHLINTTGTATITNCTINGARHQGVTIDNFNTSMAGLSMTGTTVTQTPGGDGMLMQMRGTSVLAAGTISTNSFSNNSATGLQVNNADTGNITGLTVSGNTVNANNAGMDFDLGQGSGMTLVVQNNTITNSHSQALNLVTSTSATATASMTATLRGNNIGTAGTFDSGSAIGNGIRVANGGVNVALTIDSNIIREVPNGRGIDIEPQAYTPNLNLKVKIVSNQIIAPSGTNQNIGCGVGVPCPSASIFVLSDNNGLAGVDHACTVISGNTAYNPNTLPAGGEAAYYLARRSTASNTLSIEGTKANATTEISTTNAVTGGGSNQIVDENNPGVGQSTVVAAGTCGTFPP